MIVAVDRAQHLFGLLGPARADDHVRPRRRERAHRLGADARIAAGDHHSLARQGRCPATTSQRGRTIAERRSDRVPAGWSLAYLLTVRLTGPHDRAT